MKMKFRKPNPLVSAGILFLLISVIVASKLCMVSLEEQAAQALKALKAGKLIPEGMIDPVKRYGSKESIMLKCLLPVAAQLGGDHLKTWFNIIRSLDDIVEDKDGKNVHSTVQYFLERIIEFTRLK